MHSDVGQEDDDIVGFPGKQMANDASLVAGIGDFRNDLPWLDSPVDSFILGPCESDSVASEARLTARTPQTPLPP
jgi:hypothetical protein